MKIRRTRLRVEMLEDRCTPATWGNPWPDATHLTLSFAPDGTPVGNQTSDLFQTLNALAPTATWENTILRAFQTWAAQAKIDLTVVPDGGQPFGTPGSIQSDARFGDIRIAAYAMPAGAEAFSTPFELDAGTWSGDVQLNSAASISVNGSGTGQYDLYSVMLHEAGHVFGLDDNTNPASVMDVQYLGVRSGLGAADVTAIQSLYGVPPTDAAGNNQMSTATHLTSLSSLGGVLSTTVNAGISTLQDVDYYSFNTLLNFGGVDVTMRTAGISLLTPAVTVYNAAGHVVASDVDTDPQQGGFVIQLENVRPLSTYYIEVQSGQQNVFGIGNYALTLSDLPLVENLLARVTATVTQDVGAAVNGLINNGADANNSFATATPLPAMSAGPNGSSFVSYQGSLGAATDVDYYQLQTPAAGSAGDVLTAMVWGLEYQLNANVRVFDAQHHLVAAQVVVNDGFTFTVQINNPTPSASYYVEVLAANPNGGQSVGNYFLGLDLSPNSIVLQNFEGANLTPAQPAVLNTLTVSAITQLFHFVLSATSSSSSAAGTVQMTIINSTGQTVFTLAAGTAEPVTGNVSLQPGAYTVLVASLATAGGSPASLAFLLNGDILTSPIGPEGTDPTGSPGGSPNPDPQNQDTWTDGSSSGVPSQDPSSPPYAPSNQPTVALYNPGDQTNEGSDQVALSLSASDSAQNALTFSATGLPDGLTIDSYTGVIFGAIAMDAVSATPYLVNTTATDSATGVNATQSFYWTVNPPVVTLYSPGDQSNLAGDTVNLSVSGWSTDGAALVYTAAGLPAGVSIDPNSGVISGVIPNNAASSTANVVTITGTDPSSGVSATVTFNWTVNPPVVTLYTPGDQTDLAGYTVNMSVSGWSTDGTPLVYSAAGLPAGLNIDPDSGTISGVIPNNAATSAPSAVTIMGTDPSSGVSATVSFNWTVNPPVVTLYTPGDQTDLAGYTVNMSVSGWSTDGVALVYSAAGLPAGLSIDPNSGTISGVIPNNAANSAPSVVTITGTDPSSGVSATVSFNWTVNPPVVTLYTPGDQTDLAGYTVNMSVSGWSTDGVALVYSAAGLPAGLSIDPNSGTISGVIPNNAASSTPSVVTITGTDPSSGVSATVTFNWTVNPPVVTLYTPGDQNNLAGDTVNLSVSGWSTDGASLVYSAAGLPAGLSIDPNSGVISGTIGNSASFAVTITGTDPSSGVSATVTFNWTVNPSVGNAD